ncbi:MAG: hypothetical protein OXG85_08325 [Chloroflexi bacterium]|nr:hypothetical protein [Chloroflexota bacterium]
MTTKARRVNQLHREAMDLADESFVARLEKDKERYLHFTRLALEKAAAAADLMVDEEDIEPTRSVLHRSAATLAWRCEEYDRAKRLIYRALAGNPPAEIEFELNDLLGDIKLALSSIYLNEKHLRLTLEGNDIAFGRAPAKLLVTRILSIEDMLYATANVPIPLYYDAVGASSFFVDLTVSRESQQTLPGFDNFDELVEPLIKSLDLLNRGRIDALEEKMANPRLFGDFVTAARKLAPDGDSISSVSLQASIAGSVQAITFERNQSELSEIRIPRVAKQEFTIHATEKTVRRVGVLQLADGREESVCELKTEGDGTWVIEVGDEIIHEVLGSFWKKRVEVEGQRMRRARSLKRIHLESLANIREIPNDPVQSPLISS